MRQQRDDLQKQYDALRDQLNGEFDEYAADEFTVPEEDSDLILVGQRTWSTKIEYDASQVQQRFVDAARNRMLRGRHLEDLSPDERDSLEKRARQDGNKLFKDVARISIDSKQIESAYERGRINPQDLRGAYKIKQHSSIYIRRKKPESIDDLDVV